MGLNVYLSDEVSAGEQRGNNLKRYKDFDLNAKARFWP